MVQSVKFRLISSAGRLRANVFAPLELAQKFIRKWVDEKRPGKVVFTSSVAGLISGSRGQSVLFREQARPAMHRRVASGRTAALQYSNIYHQSGAFLTGFNERMAESAFQWQDDTRNFIKRADIHNFFDFLGAKHFQRDPKEVVDAMVSIVPADVGLFRNVVSKADEDFAKTNQREAWEKRM